jgi:transcriptional regulator with XRE-family HTH domain
MATMRELIGKRVRMHRGRLGWSQERLGAALEPLLGKGWARQQVHQVETGRRVCDAGELVALASVLDVPAWELMLPDSPRQAVELTEGAPSITGHQLRKTLWGSVAMSPSEDRVMMEELNWLRNQTAIHMRRLEALAQDRRDAMVEKGKAPSLDIHVETSAKESVGKAGRRKGTRR